MDSDLSNDRSGRGEGEDAIDQLSHRISDYLDTEFNNLSDFSTLDWHTLKFELLLQQREPENFQCERTSTLSPQSQSPEAVQIQASLQNQDRDFMCSIEQNSQLQTKEEAFTMPQDMLSPEEFVHTVSESADAPQQYQEHIQEEPRHQQVRLHVTYLPGREPLSSSSTYMHDPQSIMSTVALKLPLQKTDLIFFPLMQDRDFMYRIEQNSQLQTEEEAFIKPQDMLSSEAFVHSVSESTAAQKRYQQQIQEEPRCQQVPLHVSSPPGREQLSLTSTYMHDPQPLMSTVALKPPSQMDRDFMYRIEQNSQLQTEEATITMPQEMLSLEAFVHSDSESIDGQQQYQENIQEEPLRQQDSFHVSSLPRREPLSPSSTNMHEPQPLMSTVALKPPSQMDRDFMYRIRQNSQLQTEEAAFTGSQELLSLEALVRSISESTADQQQYQENIQEEPRHQQVSLHVSSLSGRAPQSRSSTNMHKPQPLMSKVAQKVPSQMTVGQLSTERNPEEMKTMEEIQKSELNSKKERTDLHSRMHKDHPSARPHSSTVKERDEKTSDEARHDSVKENNISPFPQHNEPNPGRMKEEEEIQKLAERMKFRREELALTQQDVADQLNILTRKHNICEHFRRRYVGTIENNKLSTNRMLQLKPLLELWLESTRKESHEESGSMRGLTNVAR